MGAQRGAAEIADPSPAYVRWLWRRALEAPRVLIDHADAIVTLHGREVASGCSSRASTIAVLARNLNVGLA